MQQIGIVTAGGDAPGMNAAIRSSVRTATFNGLKGVGIERDTLDSLREKSAP